MADLTKRQQEVARLAAQGRSDKSIANQLGISARTVQTHLDRVARRLPGEGTRRMLIAQWASRTT